MGEPVEKRAGQSFAAEDLGPLFEGEVGGEDKALPFVGAADDVEEEFGAGLGKRHVAELVEDEEVMAFEVGLEALELSFFTRFEEFSN